MHPNTILQINKFFHPRAGAETVFLLTRTLLRERGHEVIDFAMEHPANLASPQESFFSPRREYVGGGSGARRVGDAVSAVYSVSARRALARLLDHQRPDVVHLHNVYHQLTLSVVDEVHARGIPCVMTLHDWKVACPAYTLFTEGAPCRRCPTSGAHNAVIHRCVKGSLPASALAAAEAVVASRRGSYGKVQRFIAPSRFAAEVAGLAGIGGERVALVPNFLPDDDFDVPVDDHDYGPNLVYAGRLDPTKGVRHLLAAFKNVAVPARLRIAGSGELEAEVRVAAEADDRITYVGRLEREALMQEFRRARAVVIPSVWEDNCPLVALEAQARARALIVSDRGGLEELVHDRETGLVVQAGKTEPLTQAIEALASDPERARDFGRRARLRVEDEHSADRHYGRLVDVYRAAIAEVS